MAEPTIADVYERLGSLKATMDGVRDDLAEARADREKLAVRVEAISERTAKLEQIVEKIEPTVDSLSNLRTKAIGGLAVIVMIGGVAGWFVGLWVTELKLWLVRVIGGH